MNNNYRNLFVVLTLVTIITLPVGARATIIDINSRVNGIGNPIEIFLESGIYNVTPIGTVDGGSFNSYTKWSRVSCTNPNGCIPTSPTTVTGWINSYRVTSENLDSATVDGSPVDLSSHPTLYGASNGLLYPNDILALTNAVSSTFTVDDDGLVGFSISDGLNVLFDNSGGMSLNVSAVPLPASLFLLTSALPLLGFSAKKGKYTKTSS